MTEVEWITTTEMPLYMLAAYPAKWNERKASLAGYHCLHRAWTRLSGVQRHYVEAVARHAEEYESREELDRLLSAVDLEYIRCRRDVGATDLYEAVRAFTQIPAQGYLIAVFRHLGFAAVGKESQCQLIREIFGNPFRPVALNPAWLTSDARVLAQQMYESRDFGAMPILADALQDAGCDNVNVLDHCREPGEHVRGCWVVDLLLGK